MSSLTSYTTKPNAIKQTTMSSDNYTTLLTKMKTNRLLTEGIGHNCAGDSLLCAFKLRKIGARRVRGYRKLKKNHS